MLRYEMSGHVGSFAADCVGDEEEIQVVMKKYGNIAAMRNGILFLLLCLCGMVCCPEAVWGQDSVTSPAPNAQGVVPPVFTRGDLQGWVQRRTHNYPEDAWDKGIEGTVLVAFTISPEGEATDPSVVRSVHPSLDTAAMETILRLPAWIPAKQNGKPVAYRYSLPVRFCKDEHVFLVTDEMPRLKSKDWRYWLDKYNRESDFYGGSIQLFTQYIMGKVYVEIIIEKNGRASNPVIIKGVPGFPELDAEAVKRVMRLPEWHPARYKGERVRMSYILPVSITPFGVCL